MPPRPRQAGKFRRRRRRSGTRLAAGRETESVGAAARQDSGRKHQEARLQALSAEDRALPYRGGGGGAAPGMDEESAHSQVLAVWLQGAGSGSMSSRTVPSI